MSMSFQVARMIFFTNAKQEGMYYVCTCIHNTWNWVLSNACAIYFYHLNSLSNNS